MKKLLRKFAIELRLGIVSCYIGTPSKQEQNLKDSIIYKMEYNLVDMLQDQHIQHNTRSSFMFVYCFKVPSFVFIECWTNLKTYTKPQKCIIRVNVYGGAF